MATLCFYWILGLTPLNHLIRAQEKLRHRQVGIFLHLHIGRRGSEKDLV